MRAALDTNVVLYAVGSPSPYRDACSTLLRRAARGDFVAEASVLLLQEFLHVRTRLMKDRAEASRTAAAIADFVILHPVSLDDGRRALEIFAAVPGLQALDALHAATCLNREIGAIVSADRGFDRVPGLLRIDPVDAEAVLLG